MTIVVLPLPQLLLFCTTPWGKLCCSTEEGAPLSSLSMLTMDNQLWLRSTAQADHLPTLSGPRNCSTKCYDSQSHINPRITNASSPGRLEPKPRAEPGTVTEHNHLGLYCDLSANSLGPVARLLGLPFPFSSPHARLGPRRAPLLRLPERRQRARSWESS